MSGWRYFAQRLDGSGAGAIFDTDLPLSGVQITKSLSGPDRISGNIAPEFASLKGADGSPVLKSWGTAIYAELDGVIKAGGIYIGPSSQDSTLTVDCMGFVGYPKGMPYTDSIAFTETDPLDVVRHIWENLQAKPYGNLGMQVSNEHSDRRIGTILEQGEFDTQSGPLKFEAGPLQLAWYKTPDLGAQIDDLAKKTPFDYIERHVWNGLEIDHFMDLHYPRLGVRRRDLRFVVGENVVSIPGVQEDGDSYANQVLLLGAGEGRDMLRGDVQNPDGRLRRVKVVTDKTARNVFDAWSRANQALRRSQGIHTITEIVVRNSPGAPVGSWEVGDEIEIEVPYGWFQGKLWVRIVGYTISPESSDAATLSVLLPPPAVVPSNLLVEP